VTAAYSVPMEASSARRCSPKVTAAEPREDADLFSPNALAPPT